MSGGPGSLYLRYKRMTQLVMTQLVRLCFTLLLILIGNSAMAAERMMPSSLAKSDVTSLMKTAEEKGTVKVIVGFRVPFAAEGKLRSADATAQRADIARAAASFRARFAGAILRKPGSFRTYQSIPFAAIEVTPQELDRLSRDPLVASINVNGVAKTQLADSIPMIRADAAHNSGFTGAGQTVAIIDTGVDKTHPFLAGKVVAEACYSQDGACPGGATSSTAPGSGMPCPGSYCAHGTHVAGIVAGKDGTSTGVAPQASLIAVQVFFRDGSGAMMSDIIAGMEYVYSRRNDFSIAAVNMSLGSGWVYPEDCSAEDTVTEAIMANLRSAGIAPVVASGNSHSTVGLSSPACLTSAISVGAVSTKDHGYCLENPKYGPTARDKVACFSNANSNLTLLAPGTAIRSSVTGTGFDVIGGTSMAAPHVAGAWAVLKQKKPSASLTDILDALKATGVMVSDYRTGQETPRIDVKGAADFLDLNAVKLSYTKVGTGQGMVSFSPSGNRQQCGGSCVVAYGSDQTVTLTATPAAGSLFEGWSGACSGMAPCTVRLNQARAVSATFSLPWFPLNFTKAGTGIGFVELINTPDNINSFCGADCAKKYNKGSVTFAVPYPAEGSLFGGWSGACEGLGHCEIPMNEAKNLTATFTREDGSEQTLTYEQTGAAGGQVLFRPFGTKPSCQGNCTVKYSKGTEVVIIADPAAGQTIFKGWSGACTTTAKTCTVTMTEARKVTADFINIATLRYVHAGLGTGNVNSVSKAFLLTSIQRSARPTARLILSHT